MVFGVLGCAKLGRRSVAAMQLLWPDEERCAHACLNLLSVVQLLRRYKIRVLLAPGLPRLGRQS